MNLGGSLPQGADGSRAEAAFTNVSIRRCGMANVPTDRKRYGEEAPSPGAGLMGDDFILPT